MENTRAIAVSAFLPTGQQVDRAVLLARRAGEDRHARIEQVIAGHLQAGGAAAEHAREQLLQPAVDLVEGLLEAAARFPIDLADRRLQRRQGRLEVLVLRVEVLLALGLLLVLLHRGEVDRPQPGDAVGIALQLSLPGGHVHIFRQRFEERLQFAPSSSQLLRQGVLLVLQTLKRQAPGLELLAQLARALLDLQPFLL
jgi:hypothetical protein